MNDPTLPITRALSEAMDRSGQERLLTLIYGDLMRIARNELKRHRGGHTLNTGALINEAYLKLFVNTTYAYGNRMHFYAAAARAMRQVIVDYARGRLAERRGGGAEHVGMECLTKDPLSIDVQSDQLIAIDRALEKLTLLDKRLVKVVELRFFAGLGVNEIADLLGVSVPTIKRDTRAAKAFMQRELSKDS